MATRRVATPEEAKRLRQQNIARALPHVSEGINDQSIIRKEGQRQAEQARRILGEQRTLQQQRLRELTALLAREEGRKFNQAIPEIAESAQARGFLETSGFGNALARERATLAGDTAFQLGRQALSDRDLEIEGVGNVGQIERDFGTSGLQRRFDVIDSGKADKLARDIAVLGVPTQRSESKNFFDSQTGGVFLNTAAQITANQAGGTYLCTYMKNNDYMTEEEVQKVHDKVFPEIATHVADWILYLINAPVFLANHASEVDWKEMKTKLCDEVLEKETSEEAFDHYKETCEALFGKFEYSEAK